jgi:hypothetical protein
LWGFCGNVRRLKSVNTVKAKSHLALRTTFR